MGPGAGLLLLLLGVSASLIDAQATGQPGKPTKEDVPRAPGGSTRPVNRCGQKRNGDDCRKIVDSIHDGSLSLECAPRAFLALPKGSKLLDLGPDSAQIACMFKNFASVRPFIDKCFSDSDRCDLLGEIKETQTCNLGERSLEVFETTWCRSSSAVPIHASEISTEKKSCEAIKADLEKIMDTLGNDASNIAPRLWPYLPAEIAALIPEETVYEKGISQSRFTTLKFGCSCECDNENARGQGRMRHHGDRARCGTEAAEALIMTLHRSERLGTIDKGKLGNLWCCIPESIHTELLLTAKTSNPSNPSSCQNLDDACQVPTRGRAASRVLEACRPQGPASSWTASDVKRLACMMTAMDPDTIANISVLALCTDENLPILSKCVAKSCRPDDAARVSAVLDKCLLGTIGSIPGITVDATTIINVVKGIGCAAATLSKADIEQMPAAVFADKQAREGIEKGLQRQPPARRWYMRKAYDMAGVPLKERLESAPAMSPINTRDLATDAPADLPIRNLTGLSKAQQLALEESSMFPQFKNPQEVVKMAPRLPRTPSTAVMDEVVAKTTDPLGDFIKIANGTCAEDDQLPHLAILLRMNLATLDETRPWSQLSRDIIQQILPCNVAFLTKISAAALADIPEDVCTTACARLAYLPTLRQHIPRPKGKAILDWCTKCTGTSNRAQLASWEVDKLGALLGFADMALIRKIGVEGIVGSKAFRLRACILPEAWEGVKEVLSGYTNQDCMGNIMLGEPSIAILIQLYDKVKACPGDALRQFITTVKEALRRGEEGDEACRAQLTEQETMTVDEDLKLEPILQEVLEDGTNQGRRRRSVAGLKCADLQDLDVYITQLSVQDIAKLPPEALYDCRIHLAYIHKIHGFSNEQVEAIASKIKQKVGANICQVSSSFLQTLGPLVAGLAVQDIRCLQNLDEDAMVAIGERPITDIQKLEALAMTYMDLKKMGPGDITSDVIAYMGHVICGLTTDQIAKIPPEEYSSASAVWGQLLIWCPEDRLEALANLAKHRTVYGPINGWKMAYHSEAGIVIAGLFGADLAMVSINSVKVWVPRAIPLIHPDKFKELKEEQLSSFTLHQAFEVTRRQRKALCQNQVDAIQAVLDGNSYTVQGGCQPQISKDTTTTNLWPRAGDGAGTSDNKQGKDKNSSPHVTASFWLSLVFIIVTRML